MLKLKTLITGSLMSLALATGLCTPAFAQYWENGDPRRVDHADQSLTITAWADGIGRDKYVVSYPGQPNVWYANGGSANAGPGETRRATTTQEWCRVRYLYGDNVRIPECWGGFMYSSHLITGLDGTHYELWFSPDSLSYFKIRNQETGIWYAHDGSANDGKLSTSKDDWCRVIYYQMAGIVKSPEECKDFNARITNAMAGNMGRGAQEAEVQFLRGQLGTEAAARGQGIGFVGAVVEEGVSRIPAIAARSFDRSGGILSSTGSGIKNVRLNNVANFGAGVGVGVAVGLGVERIKQAAGWTAQDANAGMIAAEVITTTVVTSSITTGILLAAGASFNPISMGVGVLIAGGVAAGEEIAKASKDTGIRFETGFTEQLRYSRDINGISTVLFERENPEGTFVWEKCADEGGFCAFTGIRSVRYGSGANYSQHAFADGVNCGIAGAGRGRDPASGILKSCYVQRLNYDLRANFFVKQANRAEVYLQQGPNAHCLVPNMTQMNAFGGLGQVRVVNTLAMRGTFSGACEYPNGLYKADNNPAIVFLSGPSRFPGVPELRGMGHRACVVPDMPTLGAMGASVERNVGVIPGGENVFRGRINMGACTNGVWNVVPGIEASDIGDGWAITRTPTNGGFTIVRLNAAENGWTPVPGGATRIGGSPQEPWVMNSTGAVYRGDPTGWTHIPGKVATDIGQGWIVSNEPVNGGFKIYRYSPATDGWVLVPGGAKRIGGTIEKPWVANDAGAVYEWMGTDWAVRHGVTATDVGDGTAIDGGRPVRYNPSNRTWIALSAAPQVAIGGSYDYPAVITASQGSQTVLHR